MRILFIAGFGVIGTLARYWLQGFLQDRGADGFPTGTLVVNLTACLALGVIGEYAYRHVHFPPEWRYGITIGFFGAYSTFSTLSWETIKMIEQGQWVRAGAYLIASIVGGLASVWLGIRIGAAI